MEKRHVYVISDLHLGGEPPTMMSHPESLAAFIEALPSRIESEEQLELVIAGDFIDFLAIPPLASWNPNPVVAAKKIEDTITGPHKLNQTTRLWHSAARVEKTQAVRSERRRASGEVEERDTSGLSGLRLRCATRRPNGKRSNCW